MAENSDNTVFKIGNSQIFTKNTVKTNSNNCLQIKDKVSECESEESTEDNISKFDKYVYTFLLCYANLTYGLSLTCLSPALLNFTCVLDTDAELVSHYYTLFAVGTIIGSCFGFLFKYVNRQFVLIVAILLYGIVTTLLPISPDFPVFYLFGLIGGMGAGTLDIVQTVWLIEMWVHKSGSILQLSEFSFGVGLIIGPVVVEPFVFSEENCTNADYLTAMGYSPEYYGKKLVTPFVTSGVLQILGAIFLAIMYFYHKYVPDSKEEEMEVIEKEIEEVLKPIEKLYQRRYTVQILEDKPDSRNNSLRRNIMMPRYSIQVMGNANRRIGGSLRHRDSAKYYTVPIKRRFSSFQMLDQIPKLSSKMPSKLIIALGAVSFATAIVSEAAFIDFSPTFFRYYCGVEPSKTAILLSVMTASYTATRAISIFAAIRIRPEYILSFHYLVTMGAIVLLFFSANNTVIAWIGNVFFGIGIATFWSATFSHIENYFEITDRIGTIYVSLLGLLEVATQFIEGPFLQDNPEVLLYYCFATMSVSCISFVIIRVIVFKYDGEPNTGDHSLANSKNSSHIFNTEQTVTRI